MSVRYKLNVLNWLDKQSERLAAEYTLGQAYMQSQEANMSFLVSRRRGVFPRVPDPIVEELIQAYEWTYQWRVANSLVWIEMTPLMKQLIYDTENDIGGHVGA
jgi:hypothetical protein